MPDRDGYDLVESLRRLPAPLCSIPAIAVTAYARPGDAKRAVRSGFARHVRKPVDVDRLCEAISRVVSRSRERG